MKGIRKLTFQSRQKLSNNVNLKMASDSCKQQFVHLCQEGTFFKVGVCFDIVSNVK